MRIGYDGMPFTYTRVEGMLVYNQELLSALSRLYPEHEYSFLFHSLRSSMSDVKLPVKPERMRKVVVRIPLPFRNEKHLKAYFDYLMPLALKFHKLDVFHGLRYHVPRRGKHATVTTFHDVFADSVPDVMPPNVVAQRRYWYRKAIERSDTLIAVSQSTKQELVKHYDVEPGKIRVIYEAPQSTFRVIDRETARTTVRSLLNIERPYIFASGMNRVRKNGKGILRAFQLLRKIGVKDHQLVFFGGGPRYDAEWEPLLNGLELDNDVLFFRQIDTQALAALYAAADVFLFPSLYEGFGIPILEAMLCGTPVVTSNVSAMPEVAGDAALLVDPLDSDQISETVWKVLNDSLLCTELRQRGYARVKQFSWDKTASETAAVYQELAR